MSSLSRLESIYKDLEKEHGRVMKQMDRLRDSVGVTDILPLLDELRTLLIVHFAREQLEDGFYDALGAMADSRRGELQELVDEHGAILSNLNEMLSQARASDGIDESDLIARVSKLLQQLSGHEHKEHQFAVDVLGTGSDSD
jgi:hypothetical protein